MQYKFKNSILGGTFDHLHVGHQIFLDQAFKTSDKVIIGITSQNFFKGKILPTAIEDFDIRKKSLKKYLQKKGYIKRATLITINDIYGNSLIEKEIDAIFVSETGITNAQLINNKRLEINFPEIEIIKVPFLKDGDGKIISSTNIRLGLIDKNGKSFTGGDDNIY